MDKLTSVSVCLAAVALCWTGLTFGQTRPLPRIRRLQILTTSLPAPIAGRRYEGQLNADGGRRPYHWSFAAEPVPPWIRLDEIRGTLSGIPSSSDQFSLAIQVTDSSDPPQSLTKLLSSIADVSNTTQPPPFQIITTNLPPPVAGEKYAATVKAVGGQLPYRWSIPVASLPPNLVLDEAKGVIFGMPDSSDEFSVLVQVADSSDPPLTITKLLVASSGAPLTVRWTAVPHVTVSNISGAVRVANGSRDSVDMTVIVVAVNEIGKAFSLRYEHLSLDQGRETPDLVFDVPVLSGRYSVHADAAGEVPAKKAIYRDRREVDGLAVLTP